MSKQDSVVMEMHAEILKALEPFKERVQYKHIALAFANILLELGYKQGYGDAIKQCTT